MTVKTDVLATDAKLWTTLESPIGQLLLTGDGAGLSGVYMERHINPRTDPTTDAGWTRDGAAFRPVAAQLMAYFAGDLYDFDLALSPVGTPFQLAVWDALQTIGYGETRSYGSIAAQIGRPSASRAVGMANGRNPISIIVPCHRVIGSTGRLTGYGGGLPRKQFLLELEQRRVDRSRQLF